MKKTYRPLLRFLATFLLLISTKNSFAQVVHSTDVNMENAKKQSAGWHLQQTGRLDDIWIWGTGGKAKYQVTFKDSSTKDVFSYMYTDTASHKSFVVYEDKKFKKSDSVHRFQKIYADQTLYISVTDVDLGRLSYGVPLDSCWMFKVIDGPISVYAKSFFYLTLAANGNEQEFAKWEIVGIQLNDGPIVQLTDENLKGMLGQDTAALESLEKKKYYKAIKKYNRHTKTGKKADPVSGE